MKFKSKINRVNNHTLGTLTLRIIDTVNESGIEEAKTSKQFQYLLEANSVYQQAVNPLNVRLMSEQIEGKFEERDLLFTQMYTYIKGLTVSDDAEVKIAAMKVYEEMTKFGLNFSKLRKADKTLRYIRIVESLKQTEYAEAVAATQLADKLNALDTVQREYENLYMNRGNRVAAKVAASSIRKEMEHALKMHLDETEFLRNKYETEDWKTLYANITKRIYEVTTTLSAKQTTPKLPGLNPETEAAS